MDSFQNKIQLDMGSSPSLASAFAGKSAGDEVELKVKFKIDDLDANTVTGSIDEVYVCEEEHDEDEDTEVSTSTPVMIVMSKKDRK